MRPLAPELSQELGITYMQSDKLHPKNINVVLVGFETFRHPNSPSPNQENLPVEPICWQTVKAICENGLPFSEPVNLYCYQLRNVYSFISKQIARCWEKHKPALLVVLGTYEPNFSNGSLATPSDSFIRLEKKASKFHHALQDATMVFPNENCVTYQGERYKRTRFDLEKVVNDVSNDSTGCRVKWGETKSGFYLCDYAYYNALHHDNGRSVCIRIPTNVQHSQPETYMPIVTKCIISCLEQLKDREILRPLLN